MMPLLSVRFVPSIVHPVGGFFDFLWRPHFLFYLLRSFDVSHLSRFDCRLSPHNTLFNDTTPIWMRIANRNNVLSWNNLHTPAGRRSRFLAGSTNNNVPFTIIHRRKNHTTIYSRNIASLRPEGVRTDGMPRYVFIENYRNRSYLLICPKPHPISLRSFDFRPLRYGNQRVCRCSLWWKNRELTSAATSATPIMNILDRH